jgi:hypothetical protein
MPKHKPIKFKSIEDENLVNKLKEIIGQNKVAKTTVNATLALMALGGILTLGIVAPGVLGVIGKIIHTNKKQKKERYRQMWVNFRRIKEKGNLKFVEEKDGYLVYCFSEKGKKLLKKFIFDELAIKFTKQRWDGQWRLVIFDIPEKYRLARMALTKKLKEMGFYQCQKSVWIYPFPCLEEIEFLKDFFNIKPFVKIFIVSEMTDGKVLYHFKEILKKVV